MPAPDFDALTAANDELERLLDAGELTRDSFAHVLADAERAVGERTEFLEGILMRGVELGFIRHPNRAPALRARSRDSP